jgi:hypothetical protein
VTQPCVTWDCDRPGIAHLVIRRPCGHPVALNSTGLGPKVRDGSPVAQVQRQWSCRGCIMRRAGTSAPGPSTCPVCQVREPVTVDPLMHAAHPSGVDVLCAALRDQGAVATYSGPNPRAHVTCPGCLEWLHS